MFGGPVIGGVWKPKIFQPHPFKVHTILHAFIHTVCVYYLCVCMYACTYVYVHVQYWYIHIHACIYAFMQVRMYVYSSQHLYVFVYVCNYVCIVFL